MKTALHPSGKKITFDPKWHSYIDSGGARYKSVSKILKCYAPPFDAIAISEKCAAGSNPKYTGRNPADIRQEWKTEGERGRNEGDNFHQFIESVLLGKPEPEPISERCGKLFVQGRKAVEKLLQRFELIDVEKIVFSPTLKVAGMIDLVMRDPAKNEIVVMDWKQSKEIRKENVYQCLLSPLEHLQQTELSQYTLQLSLYQFLLNKERYFQDAAGFRRAIIHVGEDFCKPIKLDYYQYEVVEMLKNETL
jgi:hypothetical protein